MISINLVNNIALLVSLSIVNGFILRKWKEGTMANQVLSGLLFGAVAVVGMMNPLRLMPGIIFDGRSIIISIAGLFGGPVTGVLSALIAAGYRAWLGGAGLLMGLSVIGESALLGIAFYYFRRRSPLASKPISLYAFGVLVHIFMLILTKALPGSVSYDVFLKIAIPVITIYPLASLLVCMLFIDLESRIKAEKALFVSEQGYRRIVETANEGILSIDTDHNITHINQKMATMLGYAPEEIIGRKIESFLYAEDLEEHGNRMKERYEGRHGFYERRFRKKDGTALWALVSSTPLIDPGGRFNGSFGMFTDISERKAAEEKIRLSLLEKETLLKEIHHRVKNNFQLVVSLLNLQSQKVQDTGLKEQFADAQNRIRAMALVHEKLYGSENFSSVNIADYVREIAGALAEGISGIKRQPSIRLDLRDVYVGIDHAIPCGLIINELITNAMKHAFAGETGALPEITVSLTGGQGSMIELSVGDNGKGLPDEFDFDGNRSLGLYLVNLLAKQLGGAISLERDSGTRFILRFTA